MSLAKVKDILVHATENKYGVAAINTINYETIRCAILAAEREKVPIIIQFYPGFEKYCPLKYISYMAKDMAQKASVPVAVHLDHSATYEIAVSGIRDGFPSIMIDGSAMPFEENVAVTKEVVKLARIFGIDVEAELGHVGVGSNLEDIVNCDCYTDVNQAVEFVERTECDSLAIAVGNAHGNYIIEPNLDFDRISQIRKKLSIPLVLHGCSGIPDDQMKEAVNQGLSKFNIATEYFHAMYQSMENQIVNENLNGNGVALLYGMQDRMIDFVVEKIRLLNPNKFSL
jgi:ketose-bisphosphate aldolase